MTVSAFGLPLLDAPDSEGRFPWQQGHKALRESMVNILLTRPGERLLRPEFGAGLQDYIHHPNSETTRALIADTTRRALQRWEPRVAVEDVEVLPDPASLARVLLAVRYRTRTGNTVESFELSLAVSPSER